MKLLLDHCVPARLRQDLTGHEVHTAAEVQFDRLRNGELLRALAAAGFDALVTVDQNLRHQQNASTLPVAVVVLRAISNDITQLRTLVPQLLVALETLAPRTFVEVP